MKIPHMLAAAGLAIATLSAATTADAQNYGNDRQHQDRGGDQQNQGDRGGDHRDQNGGNRRDEHRGYARHDNGDRYRSNRGYNRCHIEWRHHRRVRICR